MTSSLTAEEVQREIERIIRAERGGYAWHTDLAGEDWEALNRALRAEWPASNGFNISHGFNISQGQKHEVCPRCAGDGVISVSADSEQQRKEEGAREMGTDYCEDNGRGLYEVIIVDPETNRFVLMGGEMKALVIAGDGETARLKALLQAGSLPKDVEEYDIITSFLGRVRPKKAER